MEGFRARCWLPLCLLLAAGCGGQAPEPARSDAFPPEQVRLASTEPPARSELPTAELRFPDGETIVVEVARTPSARERGLMFRTGLDPDYGMLFVFSREQVLQFWMKNTYVALDMVFLDSAKRITELHAGVPGTEPGAPESRVARRSGFGRYVLELPAGAARRHGLEQGQRFEFDD
ncbi:MAG: DUF192 domain-containing protein [Elusimicrobiota bacterium]